MYTAMSSEEQTKLSDLVVSEDELNEELLHDILSRYVRISDDTGSIIRQPPFEDLIAREKILVVLLARKASVTLDEISVENEHMSPSEISEEVGIKKGTVSPSVRELDEMGLVENDDGNYRVPNHNLERVKSVIEGDE